MNKFMRAFAGVLLAGGLMLGSSPSYAVKPQTFITEFKLGVTVGKSITYYSSENQMNVALPIGIEWQCTIFKKVISNNGTSTTSGFVCWVGTTQVVVVADCASLEADHNINNFSIGETSSMISADFVAECVTYPIARNK